MKAVFITTVLATFSLFALAASETEEILRVKACEKVSEYVYNTEDMNGNTLLRTTPMQDCLEDFRVYAVDNNGDYYHVEIAAGALVDDMTFSCHVGISKSNQDLEVFESYCEMN